MDRHIGLDAHASSCTLAVVSPGGKRLGPPLVERNARSLIEAVRQGPGPRHLCLEEGTLSEWLYEVLSPHVRELVVAAVEGRPGTKGEGVTPYRTNRHHRGSASLAGGCPWTG